MARRLITHHVGSPPRRVVEQAGGLSNFVFLVIHDDGEFVVRMSPEPSKIDVFIKEQWAISKAREVGVPTPEVLLVGNKLVPLPHMISRRVKGHDAAVHPRRVQIVQELGRYAALINSIPTCAFGRTFDWSKDESSRNDTWAEFLRNELMLDARLDLLARHRMMPAASLATIRTVLETAAGASSSARLNHGDLRLKNVIVGHDAAIAAIIDWENSLSSVAPQWELSLALHDLSIDEKQAFLDGYGVVEDDLVRIAPVIKALNLINYAPTIERAAEANDTRQLARYRSRLSGNLDLYSL
jgi:hygromycin-B 4-O-kinase